MRVLAFIGAGAVLSDYANGQQQVVRAGTELPRKTFVAGSDRVYRMNTFLDASTLPDGKGVSGSEWMVNVHPSVFNSAYALRPDNPSEKEGDFWKDQPLVLANVTPIPNETTGDFSSNKRGTGSPSVSVYGRSGFLAEYLFKTNANPSIFSGTFYNNSWKITDSVGKLYTTNPSSNYFVQSSNDTYTIVKDLNRFDRVGNPGDPVDSRPDLPDGDVDQHDMNAFMACSSGPAIPLTSGCEWADADSDGDVDQTDFGFIQRSLSGDDVPASSTSN